jgi:hypothetical protein
MNYQRELDEWKKRLDSMHMRDKFPRRIYTGEIYPYKPLIQAMRKNEHIQTKGIEIIPETDQGASQEIEKPVYVTCSHCGERHITVVKREQIK